VAAQLIEGEISTEVSKHREQPYRSGPSKAWLKIKNPAAPGVLRFQDPG
jgi:ATP-dependent DNA ligase